MSDVIDAGKNKGKEMDSMWPKIKPARVIIVTNA